MWQYDSAKHELVFFDFAIGKQFRFAQRFLDKMGEAGWTGTSEFVLSNCLPRALRR